MRLSNFKLIETKGDSPLNWQYYAEVDVETRRFLWWKKVVRRKITRKFSSHYYFVDNGEWTPGAQAETLARAWEAKTGQCA